MKLKVPSTHHYSISYDVIQDPPEFTDKIFLEDFLYFLIGALKSDNIKSFTETCILFDSIYTFDQVTNFIQAQDFYSKIYFNIEEIKTKNVFHKAKDAHINWFADVLESARIKWVMSNE